MHSIPVRGDFSTGHTPPSEEGIVLADSCDELLLHVDNVQCIAYSVQRIIALSCIFALDDVICSSLFNCFMF